VKPKTKKNIGPETRAVATLLGRVEAVFWPFAGNEETRSISATMELRRDWLSGQGLPCRVHSTSENGRKTVEGIYRRLADAGLIVIAESKGRRTHVKLTWPGELAARALCGTGFPALYWDEFLHFAKLCDSTGESSLPESFVAGCEPWTASEEQAERISVQRFHFLPFHAAGMLSFWHDFRGFQWIAIEPQGREAISTLEPTWPADGLSADDRVAEIYDRAYSAETTRLATAKPSNPRDLFPPASAGIGWGDYAPVLADRKAQTR
jgi:hypothetical protein